MTPSLLANAGILDTLPNPYMIISAFHLTLYNFAIETMVRISTITYFPTAVEYSLFKLLLNVMEV
jgi:hypothetical protein